MSRRRVKNVLRTCLEFLPRGGGLRHGFRSLLQLEASRSPR